MESENKQIVTIKYKDVGAFEFNQLITKIANTQTKPAIAGQIRKLVTAIQVLRDKMHAEYKTDILENFFQKDEAGVLKKAEGGDYLPIEGKEDELKKINDSFGDRDGEIQIEGIRLLSPAMLSDVKISAREIDLLKGLYTDDSGPGVPGFFPPIVDGEPRQPRVQ